MRQPEHIDEEALLRRIAGGDKDAYRYVVARYQDAVYSMIVRQVGDRTVAEDLAQEVFVKAYVSLRGFRFESRFSTWLTRVALNHVNTYFASRRYKNRQATESFDLGRHDAASEDMESEERSQRAMLRFRRALEGLEPHFRSVIVLCGLEGKSYAEAAEILEVPIGTIRSRLNKARLRLRDKLMEMAANEP